MIHLSGHERSGVRVGPQARSQCANSRVAPTLKHRLDHAIGPTVIAPVITCTTSDLCVSAPGTERKQHVRALMTGTNNLNLHQRKHCSIVPNGNKSGYGTMASLITNRRSEPPQLLMPGPQYTRLSFLPPRLRFREGLLPLRSSCRTALQTSCDRLTLVRAQCKQRTWTACGLHDGTLGQAGSVAVNPHHSRYSCGIVRRHRPKHMFEIIATQGVREYIWVIRGR